MKLYKSLIQPYLEYAVQAWWLHLRKDIDLFEGVQRRVTKLVLDLKDLSYLERLKLLNLQTLETRRLRMGGGLIEVFKIMKGFADVD